VTLQAKAGVAATTGSQTTPAADSGYTGLYVVTVANGQTQITAGNISQVAGAPIMPSSLLSSIQTGNLSYAVATGSANAHVVALTPALQQRVDGMVIKYKAPAANTGALTLNDGLGAVSVVGGAHAALQGGETIQNGDVWVQWNSSIGGGSYIMLDSSGGALQVAPATQSNHAAQIGQFLASLSSSGYLKIPVMVSGVLRTAIVQWGNAIVAGGAGQAVATFPISFPNAFLNDVSFAGNGNVVVNGVIATTSTRTYNLVIGSTGAAASNGAACSYIAIGW